MDITNNTNVSNLIASSISKLNLNSIKRPNISLNNETTEQKAPEENIAEKQETIIPDEIPDKTVDVDDIQKYAGMIGENVSVDDINYGIMYGRSVIADYIA